MTNAMHLQLIREIKSERLGYAVYIRLSENNNFKPCEECFFNKI